MTIRFLCYKHYNAKKAKHKDGTWMKNYNNNVKSKMKCDGKDCNKTLSKDSPPSNFMWVFYSKNGLGYRVSKCSHTHPGWDDSHYKKSARNKYYKK